MLKPYGNALDLVTKCPLLERLKLASEQFPDKLLFTCEDNTLSRKQLWQHSAQLAHVLTEHGAVAGQNLCVVAGNSIEHYVALWACLRIGVRWTPLNPAFTRNELEYVFDDAQAKVILVEQDVIEQQPWLKERFGERVLVLEETLALHTKPLSSDIAKYYPWSEGETAFILYSGGTTGFPKGLMVPYAYPIYAVAKYDSVMNVQTDDLFYSVLPMYHGWLPIVILIACLYTDTSCVAPRRFSASGFLEQIRKHGATIADPFAAMIGMLLNRIPVAPDDADNPLTRCMGPMGGYDQAALERRAEFEQRFGVETFEMYGLTESGPAVTAERPGMKRWGSSGTTGGWYDIAIVDENDNPLPSGDSGEIIVRPRQSNQMACGYLNKADKTIETWRNLWIHTGDLGYLDKDGYLWFTGRMAHHVRRRGEIISVAEVEASLLSHPHVTEAAIIGVPSNVGEDDLQAFVVVSQDIDAQELATWCSERLAPFKVPRYYSFIDALPRSTTKEEIERFKLKDIGTSNAWDHEAHS